MMKTCPNCQAQYDDEMKFCLQCGTELVDAPIEEATVPAPEAAPAPEAQAQYQQPVYDPAYAQYQQPQYAAPAPAAAPDPADHTAEFDAEDIEKNKLYAISCYLLGVIGIIIALLAVKDSGFVKFHVRNVLKFWIVEIILTVVAAVLCWTFIVPIAAGVCSCIVLVLEIIAFVQACKGKAKDPAIIKSIKFLN